MGIQEINLTGFGIESSEDLTLARLTINGANGETIHATFPFSDTLQFAGIMLKCIADAAVRTGKSPLSENISLRVLDHVAVSVDIVQNDSTIVLMVQTTDKVLLKSLLNETTVARVQELISCIANAKGLPSAFANGFFYEIKPDQSEFVLHFVENPQSPGPLARVRMHTVNAMTLAGVLMEITTKVVTAGGPIPPPELSDHAAVGFAAIPTPTVANDGAIVTIPTVGGKVLRIAMPPPVLDMAKQALANLATLSAGSSKPN